MTILYIGGAAQGKRALATRIHHVSEGQAVDGSLLQSVSADTFQQVRMVDRLHLLVRHMLARKEPPTILLPLLKDKIILCDEIGYGIVPMDPFDRQWREETGRLCCLLAEQAELVVRVQCGLPQVLKGKQT